MTPFTIEHGKTAYWADFAFYGAVITGLAVFLGISVPGGAWGRVAALIALGLFAWTLFEYLLHRFVLHGIAPFKHWHEEHHLRPRALICSPTLVSASLITVLVFLPALAFGSWANASAFTLGVLAGYLAYAVVHHATHHWRADHAWLKKRKLWHARHHHGSGRRGGYGVTVPFWDHLFGSAP